MDKTLTQIQDSIETQLAQGEPLVDVLAVERTGPDGLRLFIDHPDGVDLGLCERVTKQLGELLDEYALEVSSPGTERPMSRPRHFRDHLGQTVRVKTARVFAGRSSFTGVLASAGEESVTVDVGDEAIEIPLEAIRRSTLTTSLSSTDTEAAA